MTVVVAVLTAGSAVTVVVESLVVRTVAVSFFGVTVERSILMEHFVFVTVLVTSGPQYVGTRRITLGPTRVEQTLSVWESRLASASQASARKTRRWRETNMVTDLSRIYASQGRRESKSGVVLVFRF